MTLTTLWTIVAIAAGALYLLGIPVARGHRLRGTDDPEWYTFGLWPLWVLLAVVVAVSVGLWWIGSAICKRLERWGNRLGPES